MGTFASFGVLMKSDLQVVIEQQEIAISDSIETIVFNDVLPPNLWWQPGVIPIHSHC
jgi:hypothetical protein